MKLIGRFVLGIGLATIGFSAASAAVIPYTSVPESTSPPLMTYFDIEGDATLELLTIPVGWITLTTDGPTTDSSFTTWGLAPIPEPASLLALGVGLAALGYVRRRQYSELRTAVASD